MTTIEHTLSHLEYNLPVNYLFHIHKQGTTLKARLPSTFMLTDLFTCEQNITAEKYHTATVA